jgi:tetraacyldisaccharide 4'-kinase
MARDSQALMRAWRGQSDWQAQLFSLALLPVSWLFGALVTVRRWLYLLGFFKQHMLPVPVIVVGNVLVGGVGKTPVTIALVQHLTAQGLKVGVLSRGYGRDASNGSDIRHVSANSRGRSFVVKLQITNCRRIVQAANFEQTARRRFKRSCVCRCRR